MKLFSYQNGNINITLYDDGTMVREYEGIPVPEFPSSMDIKITNYCDGACAYCHEKSILQGQHADLNILLGKLEEFPNGIEIAIGGGDALSHPNLLKFLYQLKEKGFIPNITVNQKHLNKHKELLTKLINERLVYGVGISIININQLDDIKYFNKLSPNIVHHLILGINFSTELKVIQELNRNCKILLLGYKNFGRGISYHHEEIDRNIENWRHQLPQYIEKIHLSFDNLAIEQLQLQKLLTKEQWDNFYMGDDFTFTMYVDAVEQTYAPTSTSKDRIGFNEMSIIEYFQRYRRT